MNGLKTHSSYDLLHYLHRQYPTGNCAYGDCPICGRQSVDAKVCADCLFSELQSRGASPGAVAVLRVAHDRHRDSCKRLKECEESVADWIYGSAQVIK